MSHPFDNRQFFLEMEDVAKAPLFLDILDRFTLQIDKICNEYLHPSIQETLSESSLGYKSRFWNLPPENDAGVGNEYLSVELKPCIEALGQFFKVMKDRLDAQTYQRLALQVFVMSPNQRSPITVTLCLGS